MKPKVALFDLDGVITETAKIHAEAWKEMFDDFLKGYYAKLNEKFIPFSQEDYVKFVDGKPRYKGAKNFLGSRGIELPYGNPKNLSDKTVCGLGNKKNEIYQEKLKKKKPVIHEHAVSLIKNLKRHGMKIGLVSSSKNSRKILNVCKLTYLFDSITDGVVVEKAGLSGKPDPDMFVYACEKLGASPGETLVFEDAVSGIEAGVSGNFGMVVGVSRDKSDKLEKADIIIEDLKNVTFEVIKNWFEKGVNESEWKLEYFNYTPQREELREALTATGNGYLCTRGAFETQTNSAYHYPGFYMAGIYNKLTTKIHGKNSKNNNLVNLPNWLLIKIKIKDEIIDPFESEIIDYKKTLHIKEAVLTNEVTFKDIRGRITKLEINRFASMDNPHVCSLNFNLTPMNYSEKISLISSIDGSVENDNVERYRGLKSKHLKTISAHKTSGGILLHTKTNNSNYEISISAKNKFNKRKATTKTIKEKELIGEEISFKAEEKKEYTLEKTISVFTSRDSKNPVKDSKTLLHKLPSFDKLFNEHKASWRRLWKKAGILLEGDRFSQGLLRLHTYHLLASYSHHSKDLDVGLTARGLHGEAYRGRTFWDEIFILPFYIHRFPEVAKEALLYRYNRLEQAKKYAKENGYKGAMFPWQSSDTGEEETPEIHYNPLDKSWGPDYSRLQRHISIAVFYNFYKYANHADGKKFFEEYGAEAMVEIARFWSSIAEYDKKTKKYHIKNVMGPDEFHEKYPNSKKPGINDNAYTNIMTSWLLRKSLESYKRLPKKLIEKLDIKKSELEKWEDISKNIYVPVKNGIIQQFEGFDKLKELEWKKYRAKYKDISRLDRILKAEKKSPDSYKAIKQADVLMVFYLLDFDDAIKILKDLGVKIKSPKKFIEKNYNYYISRTTHGSNLSRFVHGTIAVNLGYKESSVWDLFYDSLQLDIYDTQGGTTHEGIHTGLMAGTINVLRKHLAGIKTHHNGITLSSWILDSWKKIQFRLIHQNSWYNFIFNRQDKKQDLEVTLESGCKEAYMNYKNKKIILKKKKPKKIKLD